MDADAEAVHVPVLLREAVDLLRPAPGRVIVDATLGGGGHAEAFLEAGARVLGIDRDPAAADAARRRLARFADAGRFVVAVGRFAEVRRHMDAAGIERADGLLADLGLSSLQLADPARGFSFRSDGPPLMTMGPDAPRTAAWWVNEAPAEELARVLYEFGEEHRSRRVASAIVAARPVETASGLAGIVARALGGRRGRTHPATRAFQALRIAANDEMGELDGLLSSLDGVLSPGGRAAVVAYHSLEDRRVKGVFRARAGEGWRLLAKKVVRPSREEATTNPRARSARLRAIEKPSPQVDMS